MPYDIREIAKKVGVPRQNTDGITKGYAGSTDGSLDDQKRMRKIISSKP